MNNLDLRSWDDQIKVGPKAQRAEAVETAADKLVAEYRILAGTKRKPASDPKPGEDWLNVMADPDSAQAKIVKCLQDNNSVLPATATNIQDIRDKVRRETVVLPERISVQRSPDWS